jgi:hypothetical protein
VAQLESNLGAFAVEWDEDLEELIEPPERYWSERSALSWT